MEYEVSPNERISQDVLLAVSEAENTSLKTLPALSEVVDRTALDALFESRDDVDDNGHVSFVFSSSVVSIDYGNQIRVEPTDTLGNVDSHTGHAEPVKTVIDGAWERLHTIETGE